MNVSIDHPTGRENFTEVTVGDVTIWFSYRTPIGFMAPGWGRVVCQNAWGPTTGKHLNYVSTGPRVDHEAFGIMLEAALASELPATSLVDDGERRCEECGESFNVEETGEQDLCVACELSELNA